MDRAELEERQEEGQEVVQQLVQKLVQKGKGWRKGWRRDTKTVQADRSTERWHGEMSSSGDRLKARSYALSRRRPGCL